MSRDSTALQKSSSEALHNHNCFLFLQKCQPELQNFLDSYQSSEQKIQEKISKIQPILQQLSTYNAQSDYGRAYERLMTVVNHGADDASISQILDQFKALMVKIYHNENKILRETAEFFRNMNLRSRPGHRLEAPIHEALRHPFVLKTYQAQSPYQAGGFWARFTAVMSKNFMAKGLNTLRHYHYTDQILSAPIEYRMPCQAQRINGQARVKPVFKVFLDAKNSSDDVRPHVYFNLLRRDLRRDLKPSELLTEEQLKEAQLTAVLEELETQPLGVKVLTLPADEGYMTKKAYLSHQVLPHHPNFAAVLEKYGKILCAESDCSESTASSVPKDFFISDQTRQLLFPSDLQGLQTLFKTSCLEYLNVQDPPEDTRFSPAQQQALWFHFVNYTLPAHTLKTLNARSFNFSCKDAIDRGGVASAWYNLMASFKTTHPMTADEFDEALYAACIYVKGRGINSHIYRIWNAVNEYVNIHLDDLLKQPDKLWLVQWRDLNCPKRRIEDVLAQRLNEMNKIIPHDETSPSPMRSLINEINHLNQGIAPDRGLLLEILSRSFYIHQQSRSPSTCISTQNIQDYQALMNSLNAPKWTLLKGLMNLILGTIFLIPSLGWSKSLVTTGVSQCSFWYRQEKLVEQMNSLYRN